MLAARLEVARVAAQHLRNGLAEFLTDTFVALHGFLVLVSRAIQRVTASCIASVNEIPR